MGRSVVIHSSDTPSNNPSVTCAESNTTLISCGTRKIVTGAVDTSGTTMINFDPAQCWAGSTQSNSIEAVAVCDEIEANGEYLTSNEQFGCSSSDYIMTSCTGSNAILAGAGVVTDYSTNIIDDTSTCDAFPYNEGENVTRTISCFPRIQGNLELKCKLFGGGAGIESTANCDTDYSTIYSCSGSSTLGKVLEYYANDEENSCTAKFSSNGTAQAICCKYEEALQAGANDKSSDQNVYGQMTSDVFGWIDAIKTNVIIITLIIVLLR